MDRRERRNKFFLFFGIADEKEQVKKYQTELG